MGIINTKATTAGRVALLLSLLMLWAGCAEPIEDGERPDVRVVPRVPPAAAAYLVQAQDASERADFAAALAYTDSAARAAGEMSGRFSADVAFLRAGIFTDLNRFEEAKAAYERVLALVPDYRGAWLNLGNVDFRQNQFRQAIASYRREYQAHRDPLMLVYVGRAYAELGVVDSARAAYREALDVDDELAEAHLRLGLLADAAGDLEQALVHARRALALEPETSGHRYFVGQLLVQTGNPGEALPYLEALVEERPRDHEIHYNLGQALMRLGREEEGRLHLAAAGSLRTIDAQVSEWQTLARQQPDQPAVWATLGYVLRLAGADAEALQAYRTAQYLDPGNPEVCLEVGNLSMRHGALEEAIRQYRTALQVDSTLVAAWLNLGVAQVRAGRADEARRAWNRVIALQPDHRVARSYLARLNAPS